jgi:hypothetical protein
LRFVLGFGGVVRKIRPVVRPEKSWLVWLVCFGLFLGTTALYWPVQNYDFVDYDDSDYVFENSTVSAGITWWGVTWAFVDAHASNWHPLTWLSHMLDCQLYGLAPGWHHLTNVLLHAANCVLLFLLLRFLTGHIWRNAFIAAVFAWHPLRVESVAWIAERKDVLSGFFFMLTLLAYVKYVAVQQLSKDERASTASSKFSKACWYRLTIVVFAMGLLAKPMLVTVPIVLLLLDFWPLNRFSRTNGSHTIRLKTVLLEKAPFFLLSTLVGIITFFAQKAGAAVISMHSEGISVRLAVAITGYIQYLKKLLWPSQLTCLYLRPSTIPTAEVILAASVLVFVTILSILWLRRAPFILVGWLWFIVMLLPVIGLVQVGLQSVADRYTYLPMIGLLLGSTWAVAEFLHSKPSMGTGSAKNLVHLSGPELGGSPWLALGSVVFCCASLLILATITRQQLTFWRDTEVLMNRALDIDPRNYVAHQNLGRYFARLGRTAEAKAHHERVRELDPSYIVPGTNSVAP